MKTHSEEIETNIVKIRTQITELETQIEALEEEETFNLATEARIADLRAEINPLDSALYSLTDLQLYGFLWHRGANAPAWYKNEARIPGTRLAITSGSSPFNEWYLYTDEEELLSSLRNDSKVADTVSEYEGKLYRSEAILIDDQDESLTLAPGAQALTLRDLAEISSAF